MFHVQTLKKASTDYVEWYENTISYLEQVRPGYEGVMNWVRTESLQPRIEQDGILKSRFMQEFSGTDLDWQEVNYDIWI